MKPERPGTNGRSTCETNTVATSGPARASLPGERFEHALRTHRQVVHARAERMRDRYGRVRQTALERRLSLRQAALLLSIRSVAAAVMARGLLP